MGKGKRRLVVMLAAVMLINLLPACSNQMEEVQAVQENPETTDIQDTEVSGEIGIDIQDQIIDGLTYTLDMLTADQLTIFVNASGMYIEDIFGGAKTIAQVDELQNLIVDAQIMENILPGNGIKLFNEWKTANGYYEQFEGLVEETTPPATSETPATTAPSTQTPSTQTPTPQTPQQGNKPQTNPDQQGSQTDNQNGSGSWGTTPEEGSGNYNADDAQPGTIDPDKWQ